MADFVPNQEQQDLLNQGVDRGAVETLATDTDALKQRPDQVEAALTAQGFKPAESAEDTLAAAGFKPAESPTPAAPANRNPFSWLRAKLFSEDKAKAEQAKQEAALSAGGFKEADALKTQSDDQLISNHDFSPFEYYAKHKDEINNDPKTLDRLTNIHVQKTKQSGILPTPKAAWEGLKSFVPNVAKMGLGLGEVVGSGLNMPVAAVQDAAAHLTGKGELGNQITDEAVRSGTEALSGAVADTAGLVNQVQNAARYFHITKPWAKMTPGEARENFLALAEKQHELAQMSSGHVEALKPTTEELSTEGKPVSEENAQLATEGGPASWLAYSKAFGAAGEAAAKAAPVLKQIPGVQKAVDLAKAAPGAIVGAGLKAAGAGAEGGAKVAEVGAKVAPVAAGIHALATGDLKEGLAALFFGGKAKEAILSGAEKLRGVGETLSDAGKQVSGDIPRSVNTSRAIDVSKAIGETFGRAGLGYAGDTLIAKAGSNESKDAENVMPFMAVMGGLHGAHEGAKGVIGNEFIQKRGADVGRTASPAYGDNPILDKAHDEGVKALQDPQQRNVVNFLREMGRKVGARVYQMADSKAFEQAFISSQEAKQGAPLSDAAKQQAADIAQNQGYFTSDIPDANGNKQPVVFLNNSGPTAAPHELAHAFQALLGDDANRKIDAAVRQEYSPEEFDRAGLDYTRRLAGQPALDENGGDWRRALEQAPGVGLAPDTYIARELAADNFQAAFNNRGADALKPSLYRKSLAFLSRFVGGGDEKALPDLAGEQSPLIMQKTAEAAHGLTTDKARLKSTRDNDFELRQKARDAAPVPITPKGPEAAPKGPDVRAEEADKAEKIASELNPRDPAKEAILGKVADAIRSGSGVRVDYHNAPGEPAGSPSMSREDRRSVVETFRDMPNDVRPLWEKLHFPDRVEQTKNKGPQLVGWSPENYAANAHRLANWLNQVGRTDLSPYPIDANTGNFTADGWRNLYKDARTFVDNQQAGGTGSGQPLIVPKGLDVRVPELKHSELSPLDQNTADFHNILFNVMLPETVRSRKGVMPGNIKGQEIAKANESLIGPRVTEPGRARSQDEFKEFPGRTIQEVNPLRAEMESEGEKQKKPFPGLIETNQRLNLEHIADVNPAPEAPPIRGVTDTLRGGFLPKEAEDVAAMSPDDFFKWAQTQPRQSITPAAYKLGLTIKDNPLDVADLKNKHDLLANEAGTLLRAGEFEKAQQRAVQAQFFREAHEAATGTGSAKEVRDEFNTQFVRRDKGQALPAEQQEAAQKDSDFENEFAQSVIHRGAKVEDFPYYHDYQKTVDAESKMIPAEAKNILFIGSGPMPLSPMLFAKKFPNASVHIMDVSKSALSTGEQVAAKSGVTLGNSIVADAGTYKGFGKYDAVVLSLEAGPTDATKRQVLSNITGQLSGDAALLVRGSAGKAGGEAFVNSKELLPAGWSSKNSASTFGGYGETHLVEPAKDTLNHLFSAREFDDELGKVREGKSDGQTFNLDGSVFTPPAGKKLDIVTLASENVPVSGLSPERIRQALAPYADALTYDDDIKPGVFKMADGKTASIDLNAVVDQAHRKNSVAFARDNDQQAIFDLDKFETINTGGKGETVLRTPEHIATALPDLIAGKPVDVAGIAGKNPEPLQGAAKPKLRPPLADEPDAIKYHGAAIRTKDGKVHTGETHGEAQFKANNEKPGSAEGATDGFVTNGGEFLDRKAAFKRAKDYGQITDDDFNPRNGELESVSFDHSMRSRLLEGRNYYVEGAAKPKKADEFKFKPGTNGGFSRAWILPTGKVEQIGGTWHHDWLANSPEGKAAQAKYGFKTPPFEGVDASGVRETALNKGFVRVNMNVHNGLLTVEARAKDWPKQKEQVRQLVESNLDGIDRMRVHLMNADSTAVQDSAIKNLFDYGTDKEKMDNLPFISEGAEEVRQTRGPAVPVTAEKSEARFGGYGGEPIFKVFDKSGNLVSTERNYDKAEKLAQANGGSITMSKSFSAAALPKKDKGYEAGEYWLGKGKLNHAPDGHEQWAVENFGGEHSGGDEDKFGQRYENYGRAEKAGYTRVVVSPHDIDADSQTHQRWEDVPRKDRAALEDLAFEKGLPVLFNGNEVVEKPKAPEGQAAPRKPTSPETAEEAVREFGLTHDLNEAGYILPDGRMLDFSEKNNGGDGGIRTLDHRAVARLDSLGGESGSAAMMNFLIKTGAARLSYFGAREGGPLSIHTSGVPSPGLISELGKLFKDYQITKAYVDLDDSTGQVLNSKDILNPTAGKLRAFYSEGGQAAPRKPTLAEDVGLPGLDVGRSFNRRAISEMTKEELKRHFPEAVVPHASDEVIDSNITGSPLAKQAGSRDAAVKAFSDKLVDFAKQSKSEPWFESGAKWYSEFTPMLKKEFGADAPLFAELLAATSPQTDPHQNFSYAFDAFQKFKRGDYKPMLDKFEDGFTRLEDGRLEAAYKRDVPAEDRPDNISPATLMRWWVDKHDLIARQSNGNKIGLHSDAVLQVLARRWLNMNRGPKTRNFVANLLGEGDGATIDLWADRTMRRLGYEGLKDRWRILPENQAGVSDDDFAFSQDAFRHAAERLNMKPSDLQGALWFAEKKHWADNGWGRLDLGDYRTEMKDLDLRRRGWAQQEQLKEGAPKKPKKAEQLEILPRGQAAPGGTVTASTGAAPRPRPANIIISGKDDQKKKTEGGGVSRFFNVKPTPVAAREAPSTPWARSYSNPETAPAPSTKSDWSEIEDRAAKRQEVADKLGDFSRRVLSNPKLMGEKSWLK